MASCDSDEPAAGTTHHPTIGAIHRATKNVWRKKFRALRHSETAQTSPAHRPPNTAAKIMKA